MFASLHSELSSKQLRAIIFSLCSEVALLLVIVAHGIPQMSGPSIRPHLAHSTTTPIYFQPQSTAPTAPEPPDPTPAHELATKAKTSAPTAETKTPDTDDDQATNEIEAPPSQNWSMDAMPGSFTVFGHEIHTAQPLFTPEPPILHGEIIEPARGKDLVLEIVINDQGLIAQATVLQGIGYGVENEIMETLRQWTFIPAKVNGVAVVSRRQLRFHFPG